MTPWRYRPAAPGASPASVEQRAAAEGAALPPAFASSAVGNDPFAADQAQGSADLSEWPPTGRERNLALLALGGSWWAPGALVRVAGSKLRAEKIKHQLRIERAAADVIERVQGGPR